MPFASPAHRLSFFDPDYDRYADTTASEAGAAEAVTTTDAPKRRGRRRVLRAAIALALGLGVSAIVPVASASADPTANDWYRLRMCESSNNYKINTGNGHYGAYQFDLPTWRSVGGTGYPNQASPAEQDARALALYHLRGWQPWQCAKIVGLVNDKDANSTTKVAVAIAPAPAAAPAASVAPAWPGPQYFSYGDHSTTIKRFQDQMHARGFFPVGTGDFGPNTLAMVKRLQGANGLPQTGLLGPVTWKLAWTGKY
ncbi:MAG: transglycosylase family protein [Actinobacteria bacterium]|nr:transglycosylase family protein [Actinomycetota bacterium]